MTEPTNMTMDMLQHYVGTLNKIFMFAHPKYFGGFQDVIYPCLLQSKVNGAIVHFTGNKKGTVVIQGLGVDHEGYYSENWDMDSFGPISRNQ